MLPDIQQYSHSHVTIYPNFQGSDTGDHVMSRLEKAKHTHINPAHAHGNEPFKDHKYFAGKSDYMAGMKQDMQKLPPVVAIKHPGDDSKHIVLDGNHRLHTHKAAGVDAMKAHVLSHKDIHLAVHDYDDRRNSPKNNVSLHGIVQRHGGDMNKPIPELDNKTLGHYFAGGMSAQTESKKKKKNKSKKAPLKGNRYGYGKGLSPADQRRQKKAFKKNVKKAKAGDKSAYEPTAVDKEVMADREAGRRPEAPESKYNDSMETPKIKVRIFSEGDEDKHQLVPMHFKPGNEEDHPHYHPHFDPVKGLGTTGYNREIHEGGRGFIRHMKPSEFLATAEHLDTPRPGSTEHIVKHLKSGGRLGNPLLSVEWNKHSNSFDTVGHEGRHRMMAYKDVHGDKPVPVHINVHKHRPHNTPEDKWREMSKAEINPEGAIRASATNNDLDDMIGKMKADKAFDSLNTDRSSPTTQDGPSVQDVLDLLNGKSKKSESMETPKLKVSILNEDWKKAIAKKAKKSGKSAAVLRKVYKRGLAAYASGHRPGMSQHAWAMARVNSYLRGGPARKVDSDIKEGVEHGTQFKMVHVGSDQEGRKTYKMHAHCDHDGHAGHVKFSTHKGHTYIHAMEINDRLRRQGYGPALMQEIYRMHDEDPRQHGNIHYAGHHEDNAQMPMPEALNIEDIPVAGGDLARLQRGKRPLRGIRAKIVDAGSSIRRGVRRVMRVIRGDNQPISIRKESVEKSGERFSGVNKPKRTPGASKKFAVLAKEGGKTRIVRFGDPNMKIKKHIKGRRKNFRARHGCDKGKLSKLTARYWSCRKW